jgi:hypothetical protein
MKFVDMNKYELERFESEKRTEAKRNKQWVTKLLKQIRNGKRN